MRRFSRIVSRRCARSMPDRARTASNASGDGNRDRTVCNFAVDVRRRRLGRRIPIHFGQLQLAIDQLGQHVAHGIARLARRRRAPARDAAFTSLNVIRLPPTTASTRSMTSPRLARPRGQARRTKAPRHKRPAVPIARSPFVHSSILHCEPALERLPERDEPGRAVVSLRLGIDLETHVEADRPDRRLVAEAKPDRGPQREQIDVGGMGKHVAGVDEADSPEAPCEPGCAARR